MTPSKPIRGLSRAVAQGPKVFLRHPGGSDMAEWVKLREVSEAFLVPWDPSPPGEDFPRPPEEMFYRLLDTADTEHSQRFLICTLAEGAIVGQVSLNQIFRGPFWNCTTGYWVGQPFARKGYMTEGLRLCLAIAFQKFNLHRVEANIIPRNEPSKALVRRLGFRYEGTALRYLRINGVWEDHEHWAITREEWTPIGA
ncbi:MAG: GNAT family N-acetyltransferase [Tepidisphaera sp.]|nr:GNAT family N-acetyltransferase [Tepidisphaera sp.]